VEDQQPAAGTPPRSHIDVLRDTVDLGRKLEPSQPAPTTSAER
jgi:hypothetical protein